MSFHNVLPKISMALLIITGLVFFAIIISAIQEKNVINKKRSYNIELLGWPKEFNDQDIVKFYGQDGDVRKVVRIKTPEGWLVFYNTAWYSDTRAIVVKDPKHEWKVTTVSPQSQE